MYSPTSTAGRVFVRSRPTVSTVPIEEWRAPPPGRNNKVSGTRGTQSDDVVRDTRESSTKLLSVASDNNEARDNRACGAEPLDVDRGTVSVEECPDNRRLVNQSSMSL